MIAHDPAKQESYPDPPEHTTDPPTWFEWMHHHPGGIVAALDAAERARMFRNLIAYAVGSLGEEILLIRLEQDAQRRAARKAAAREHAGEPF